MATETPHTRNQLQADIDTIRANYVFSCNAGSSFARVVDAAQRYCDTLPKVHHQTVWAVAEAFAIPNNFVICELNGSCEL